MSATEEDILHRSQELGRILAARKMTMCAAESCTGGLIGASVTSVPGSSGFFLGSAVTYANSAKEDLLRVPRGILFEYGAVSAQTAGCMARGAVSLYHSDVAVAVTGIAGPGGGTAEKPVGLVYIGVSDGIHTETRKFRFAGDRDEVRRSTVSNALDMLIRFLDCCSKI